MRYFLILTMVMFMDSASAARQLILVITPTWDTHQASLQRYERSSEGGTWQAVGKSMPVVIGKKGLGWGSGLHTEVAAANAPIKKEGDGKAPAGRFSLGTAYGYEKPQQKLKVDFLQVTDDHRCVDDIASKFYNQIVNQKTVSVDWKSAEEMKRKDDMYKYGLVVHHNTHPTKAGGGSCIFIHIWRSAEEGTAGCTAMTEENLVSVLEWLNPRLAPELVQLAQADYQRLKNVWKLP